MLSPELRRKLSRLNASRQQSVVGAEGKGTHAPNESPAPSPECLNRLEELLPGRVHEHEGGRLYVVERSLDTLYPAAKEKLVSSVQEIRRLGCEPEDVLFLDIETCGLANCPLFLVGVMLVRRSPDESGAARGRQLSIHQFFARDYTEEPALLLYLKEVISAYRMLVTFNGKTFDIPYMRDRMVFHRIEHEFDQEHLDLLPEARRKWRDELPDCRLQTLEEHIVGRRRVGDTPGELIPQLYHDFVRTGNAAPLEGVFHHNALDLITMAELLPEIGG